MYFRHLVRAVLLVPLLAVAAPAQAQTPTPDHRSAVIYRLNDNATFQEGCFDPCKCPIGPELSVRGTFKLGPASPGNVVDFREVKQVNWSVHFGDTLVHTITGSGVYRITNFDPNRQHSLDLDLSIDGAAAQHFFSDFVPVSSNDGSIDIPISMNGVYCYDIVIRVSASPVPRDEIRRYTLVNGSSYQIACFDPCDCVSQHPRPMRGRFKLVPLLDYGTYAEYSIVDAHLLVQSPSIVDAILTINGIGNYTLVQGFAGPAHEMDVSLSINGNTPILFDQELENTDTLFPAIDIVLDTNEMVCTDTVLTLKARPWSMVSPAVGKR